MEDFSFVDLASAVGVAIVLEGAAYALFPEAMQRLMAQVQTLPPSALRLGGLAAAVGGVVAVWAVRR